MCTEQCLRHAAAHPVVSRRGALAGLAAAGALLAAPAPARAAPHRTVRDLTHPFTTTFPTFADGEEARRGPYKSIETDGYYMQEWRIVEHTGTHVDAPNHFVKGGRAVTDLTPDELVLPAAVISIARRAAHDPDAVLTVADLAAHEREHGRIPPGAAVLLHTGWDRRAGSAPRYRNPDGAGVMHFPGFGADACEWLLTKRRIRSLGIDTLSLDPGESADYPVHFMLLGADRYGLENLRGLDTMPPHGATLVVGVTPWEEGSGGPARVLALA
ncbi:cyclase family protein [Catenuloplanes japonicus]|uniref:cyclase family protein n=1 Tax=Catenuloplanes japonicus TaxID=33876 RepID=UPI000525C2E1|nr:cyclase family protein [Catenuloplanes japonicus]